MPKYDKNTKRGRNEAIVNVRKNFPNLSLAEIGIMFGDNGKPLSPQRVHQILHKADKGG